MPRRTIDWIAIEGEYRAGQKSVREIARDHGITDTPIHRRAKKEGWARNPGEVQRRRVEAHFAGIAPGLQAGLQSVAAATDAAISDMELGLRNARRIMERARDMIEVTEDVRELKALGECNKLSIETIRTIRGLDETPHETVALPLAEARAKLRELAGGKHDG